MTTYRKEVNTMSIYERMEIECRKFVAIFNSQDHGDLKACLRQGMLPYVYINNVDNVPFAGECCKRAMASCDESLVDITF